jgi:CDGSH-type Zn-finger protein
MSESPKKITITRNGPYLVSGGVPLAKQTIGTNAQGESTKWVEGDPLPEQEKYALCRCGASQKKPFCDGSHARVGFDGTETASRAPFMKQAKVLDGPVLQLADNESLCAFARFCDPHGQVWSQVERTDDAKVRQQFETQVGGCASGRLVALDKASGRALEPKLPESIGLVEDPQRGCSGPLWVRGGIEIAGADGHAYEVRNRVTLCRCGQSSNKPFCDGSHVSAKFNDGL